MIERYRGDERVYHHTAPISMNYALLEALRLVDEEGSEARWRATSATITRWKAGLAAMGLELRSARGPPAVDAEQCGIPAGVDDAVVRKALLERVRVEIGGGLGPMKGTVWRVGLMGESSTEANVLLLLSALERLLPRCGYAVHAGAGVAAAARQLAR
jgi:alanine-glyoxylate transaminase/serine-glyoxylate transaminase/serine-pyruvate transaminase